jgi:hypothetical protein|tara:strand:- start:746 stop:1135 length:390 start_codon:yes stop_codon:yes gene_type:complete
MAGIRAIAHTVSNDEPSFLLREFPKKTAFGERWMQEVWVIRSDSPAVFTQDIGSVESMGDAKPLNVVGGDPVNNVICETVGSLRDLADEKRSFGYSDDLYDIAPTGTPKQWLDAYYEDRERRYNRGKTQ